MLIGMALGRYGSVQCDRNGVRRRPAQASLPPAPRARRETYETIRKIGEGGQGKVYVVKRLSDRKVMVQKEQRRYDMFDRTPLELHLFETVLTGHPRSIIDLDRASCTKADGTLVLLQEYCRGGDLADFVPRSGDKGCSERFLWDVFTQLAEAIAFLHYGYNPRARDGNMRPRNWARVVHRDIKPENVFLRRKIESGKQVPEIVLGDFGLATLQPSSRGAGTDEWMAPEIPLVTKQSDVWGVGAVVHALAHGRGPVGRPPRDWPRGREAEKRWYTHPQARKPKQLPKSYSNALNRIMMACLETTPYKRIDSYELINKLIIDR